MKGFPSQERGGEEEAAARLDGWLLAALTLLALLLRLYMLGRWSFWEDEVFTIRDMSHSVETLLFLEGNTRHFLFPLLQKGFLPLLPGVGEGSYRLLSVLFGVASVPVLVLFGRSLVGRGGAFLAALFLAICPWHVYWSQNCRYYTLTALLSLVTCWLFWASLHRRRALLPLLFSFVPAGLAAFSHPSAAFLVGGLALFMLSRLLLARGAAGRERRLKARVFLLLVGVGTVVLSYWLSPALESFQQAKAPNPLSHLAHTMLYYVSIPLIVLGLLAWFPLRRKRPEAALFIAYQVVVPLAGITFLGIFVRVTAQYLFFTLPFYCLAAGWGAWHSLRHRVEGEGRGMHRALRLAPLLLVALPYLAQLYLYFRYEQGWRPRWREAAMEVQAIRRDRDRVAVTNATPVEYYLNPDLYARERPERQVVDLQSWDMEQKLDDLLAPAAPGRAILVLHLPVLAEKDPGGRHWARIRREMRLHRILPAWSGPRDLTLYIFVGPGESAGGGSPR